MSRKAIHPGNILRDELACMMINAKTLADNLGVPANRITQILRGNRALTADTALRLSRFFGTSAEFWLNLQKQYELRLAEQSHGKQIKKTVKQWHA